MTPLHIREWLEGLSLASSAGDDQSVAAYLASHRVAAESVRPLVRIESDHYTRSLLLRTMRWQCILMCWAAGHRTPIHDHSGLPAWMTLVSGRLAVRNFALRRRDESGERCELEECDVALLECGELDSPTHAEAGIHEVRHASSARQAVVSVHLYREPTRGCGAYDTRTGTYRRIPMTLDRDLTPYFPVPLSVVAPAARQLASAR